MGVHQKAVKRVVGAEPGGEDRAEIVSTPLGPLLLVADGVGGRAGGAEAADRAVEWIGQQARRGPRSGGEWADTLAELDRGLREDADAGETTLVVVGVGPDRLVGASVGDSGAFLFGEGLTRELTAAQHAKPFLGTGAATPVSFEHARLEGRLLLATDGLLGYAAPPEIRGAALRTDLAAAADALLELVRLPSGGLWDDVALILCAL